VRRHSVFRIDALQALGLELVAIRVDLECLCPEVKWLDEEASRGIPLQAPMFLPKKYEKRIEAAIRRVGEAFYQEMKSKHERRQ
jgi:hypothetical protein